MTQIARPAVDEIQFSGKTPRQLFQMEEFRTGGYTLLEEVTAYADPKTGLRQSVHADYERGIWCPEVVLTDNPNQSESELPVYKWFRRPSIIKFHETGGSKEADLIAGESEEKPGEKRWEIDGEEFAYECPPSGYVVPATSGRFNGYWRHPETGAAVATVPDRNVAVDLNEAYIRSHEKDFAGWDIFDSTLQRWRNELEEREYERIFGSADLERKLALTETPFQWSPAPDIGVRAVGRGFWNREDGPFVAFLLDDLGGFPDVGARLRSKA